MFGYPNLNVKEDSLSMWLTPTGLLSTTDPNLNARTVYYRQVTGSHPSYTLLERNSISTGTSDLGLDYDETVPWAIVNNKSITINTNCRLFAILNSDPNLFSDYDVGLVSTNRQTRNIAEVIFHYSPSIFYQYNELISQDLSYPQRNFSTKFKVTFQDEAEQMPNIENYGTASSPEVRVRRAFGSEYNPPDLVLIDGDQIVGMRGIEAENELSFSFTLMGLTIHQS
ncbi:hypothetical protein NON20_08730 [Synechocystis sp. B12]|nr:hypothetical protein NON20_08730 [Synechocystis sp. B12]